MDAEKTLLWSKLDAFAFDEPGTEFTFAQRLARENRWKLAFAERAIQEYKKFVFLCISGAEPVTPSFVVDQVWHLHLTYTRNYWCKFCQVLGRPLHHDPTQGGTQE